MPSVNNVSAGKPKVGGCIYRAPVGTSLPTDVTTALNGSFVEMGYISEDGVTNSNSPSSNKIKAWGGDVVLIIQEGKEDTFKYKLIECTNLEAIKSVYGADNVTGALATGITIKANSKQQSPYSYVIDMVMNNNAARRIVIPNGAVSAVGDIVYKDSDVIGYETTLDCLPDSNGNTHYEYVQTTGSTGASGSSGSTGQ